jgi:hypothetical protein
MRAIHQFPPLACIDFPNLSSTGLADTPHTREAGLIQYPDVADRLGFSSLRREPRWSVLGRSSTFFRTDTKRELGGYLLRDGAQGDPGVGLLHSHRMEHPNAKSVAPDYANPRR